MLALEEAFPEQAERLFDSLSSSLQRRMRDERFQRTIVAGRLKAMREELKAAKLAKQTVAARKEARQKGTRPNEVSVDTGEREDTAPWREQGRRDVAQRREMMARRETAWRELERREMAWRDTRHRDTARGEISSPALQVKMTHVTRWALSRD